ncbi:MAG: DNA polymerase domain-containing protein, partial [Candidatus Xenobia bacterium]
RAISAILSNSYFLQTQIFPFNYGTVLVRGNATRINALFLREYLRQRQSIPPEPESAPSYEGGYTDIFAEGVQKNVVHCDVQSLYPSVMLAWKIAPQCDDLGVFLPLLQDLKTFRVEAKKQAQTAP